MAWSIRKTSKEFHKNREIVRLRDHGQCIRCLTLEDRFVLGRDVDHFIPHVKGGSDHIMNLWLLCEQCHRQKTQREANGHSGFPLRYDLSGWPIEEQDWLDIIKQRTIEYYNQRGWQIPEERVN